MSHYEEANWEVPYCEFTATPDGFSVRFTKHAALTPGKEALLSIAGVVAAIVIFIVAIAVGFSAGAGAGFLIGVVLLGGLIWLAVTQGRVTTQISVTKDAIIIDGRRFRRADFTAFSIDHTTKRGAETMAVLRYRYGNVGLPFGGLWKQNEANDFTAALNDYLRAVPVAGDEASMSPAALRSARPTDF